MAEIHDSLKVIETVNGVDIHVTDEGSFAAVINGAVVRLSNKSMLRRRIEGYVTPVKCIGMAHYWHKPEVREIARVTRSRQVVYLRDYGYGRQEKSESQSGWYFHTDEAEAALALIAERYDQLVKDFNRVVQGLRPVTQATFNERQIELRARNIDEAMEGNADADPY